MDLRRLRYMLAQWRREDYLFYAGAVLALIGALAPWISVGGGSIGGLSVHGAWVVILAATGVLCYYKLSLPGAALCLGLILLIGVYEVFQLRSDFGSFVEVGWGLYAVIVAGVISLLGLRLASA